MEILVKADGDLADEERREMDRAIDAAFSAEEAGQADSIVWVQSNDWHILVCEQGRVASHVAIVERTVAVAGQDLRVGGIGAVATQPERQGRGLASAAMRHAAAFMFAPLELDFGLLFCGSSMIPFYRRLGWQPVVGPVLIEQPRGKVTYSDPVMILHCRKQDWPEGVIDLRGLPW